MIKEKEIIELRNKVDEIDTNLVKIINQRFNLCRCIGNIKKENGLPVEDLERESQLIGKRINSSNLNEEFTKNFFQLIFNEAKRLQK
jgi:chorismate mutase